MEVERIQVPISTLPMKQPDVLPTESKLQKAEQPAITTTKESVLEVPTIDMSVDSSSLVEAITKASSEWGIFQVVNHGIPGEVIARMQEAGKQFFELPDEEKMKYAKEEEMGVSKKAGVEGYWRNVSPGSSVPDEKMAWCNHLFHKIWPPSSINYNFWPKSPSFYKEANEVYCDHLRTVAARIFKCLSVGLGLHETAMLQSSGGDKLEYLMKINYYPPCPRPDLVTGVPPHTDFSTLTILVPNEVPGLQVLRDEQWYDAKYIPHALVVHIGDQIEIMSNGKYKAVNHRTTVNKHKLRMSWPVFLEPPQEKVVGPLVGDDDKENKLVEPKYKSQKFCDYVYNKLHNKSK